MTTTETKYYTTSTYQRKFMPKKEMTKKRALAVMAMFIIGALALIPIAGIILKALGYLFLLGWNLW